MIRFLGFFLVISELGSQIYIANLAIVIIWVFSATFRHEIRLYAIYIDKKVQNTFFNILEPLWKSALTILNFLEHLQLSHILLPRQHCDIIEKLLKYYWILLSKRWPRKSTTPSSTLWCSSYQVRWSLAMGRYFVFAWNEKIQIKWLFDGHMVLS